MADLTLLTDLARTVWPHATHVAVLTLYGSLAVSVDGEWYLTMPKDHPRARAALEAALTALATAPRERAGRVVDVSPAGVVISMDPVDGDA